MNPDILLNILIVDDEPLVREGLRSILHNLSGEYKIGRISEAPDGEKAIQNLLENEFNLVFSDIVMPNIDGIELLSWISINRPDCHRIVLSCHDDYSYVRDSFKHRVVDYILKYDISPNIVREVLEKVISSIREESSFSEKKREVSTGVSQQLRRDIKQNSNFRIVSFRFNRLSLSENRLADIFARAVRQNLETICNEKIRVHNLKSEMYLILLLIDADRPLKSIYFDRIHTLISEAVLKVEQLSILYGDNFSEFIALSSEIDKMEQIERITFLSGEGVFRLSDYNSSGNSDGKTSITKLKIALYKELSDKKIANSRRLLSQLTEYFMKTPISINEIKNIYIEFFDLIVLLNREALNELNDNEIQGVRDNMNNAPYFSVLKKELDRILEEITKAEIFIRDQDRVSTGIRQALIYIYSNYHNSNLSLAEVSHKLNYSPSYLSRLFKKELDQNLVTYINDLRLKKAKELLLTGKYLIYETAEVVGFNNYNYFSKLYKQKYGVSPKEDINNFDMSLRG